MYTKNRVYNLVAFTCRRISRSLRLLQARICRIRLSVGSIS